MNGYTTIFKVIGKSLSTGQHYFEKCFMSLAGAQADIDRRIKETASVLGWKLLSDLWRNDDEESRVHCYRLVTIRTCNKEEIEYRIEADNIYP